MHPTDGELLLYAEPNQREGGFQVRSHLATCASCSVRLQVLLSELEQAAHTLSVLDGPVPAVDAGVLMERARQGMGRSSPPRLSRAAAVAALLVLAGAAAAIPGSPVRRWLAEQRTGTSSIVV